MKIVHKDITIYFGDKEVSLHSHEIKPGCIDRIQNRLHEIMETQSLYFVEQVHGVKGYHIDEDKLAHIPSFSPDQEGDFLYTACRQIALGVITADCLPVIMYHPQGIISVVHAGWKGSFENIISTSLQDLLQTYPGIQVSEFIVYIGPAAKACCYQVQEDFRKKFIKKYPWNSSCFVQKQGNWYFDNADFTSNLLQKIGILPENIYTKWNICTICNENYCSYRREREKAGRQITLVMLNALL